MTASIRVVRHHSYKTPLHKTPAMLKRTRILVANLMRSNFIDQAPGHGAYYTKDISKRIRVTVLIPAHNEEVKIANTIESLKKQKRKTNKIIVVADNCTDNTVKISKKLGAEIFKTKNNHHKKAGALNQVLHKLLPKLNHSDLVLVMDADSVISEDFIQVAIEKMLARPDLTAVGGLFYGDDGGGFVGQLQRNEYARYQRQIGRRKGEVFVLTGTASLFRAPALDAVARSRGSLIPGVPGDVYDTQSLTEDNEMTIALKSIGGVLASPKECRVYTEVMPTWKDLWRQRNRWQRGALENIGAYGLTRATFRYWFQQVGLGYGVIALNSYILLMLITFLSVDKFEPILFWLAIGCIFLIERIVTVWRAGPKAVLIAAPLFIEIAYDIFIQAAFVKSLFDIMFSNEAKWHHLGYER